MYLIEEISKRVKKDERVLVTTLTKRMAEELTKYLENIGIKCRYIHSEVNVLDRVEILRELRLGVFDVLVGVNLFKGRAGIYRRFHWLLYWMLIRRAS